MQGANGEMFFSLVFIFYLFPLFLYLEICNCWPIKVEELSPMYISMPLGGCYESLAGTVGGLKLSL
jgi:hypothetical protein